MTEQEKRLIKRCPHCNSNNIRKSKYIYTKIKNSDDKKAATVERSPRYTCINCRKKFDDPKKTESVTKPLIPKRLIEIFEKKKDKKQLVECDLS